MDTLESKWKLLKIEFKTRISSPFKHPEFIIYFLVVICIIGIAGPLLTIYLERDLMHNGTNHHFSNKHVILSIASYFIALLTSSAVDLILSSKSLVDQSQMLRKSWIMIGIGSIVIGIIFMGLSLATSEICILGYVISVIGLLFSWFIWWITNAANPNLTDDSENALITIGGPPSNINSSSLQLVGNLTGFQV